MTRRPSWPVAPVMAMIVMFLFLFSGRSSSRPIAYFS
ncbi:hypothetical protein EIB18_17835 [Caulobacter vibrioides]|uniref:Uncharacterized protein n=1 Tax=Caulobacter vibrioides (strain ATCC 19089 / CIP 103742 / CB 15) TaxID=190650 RepID=Q9A337_CAUVC|nr:hypothetical protein CC_3369 [Caulobacter vibrioides CB15]AVG21572.1 hypothetical protein CA608_20465 [Caulobacter vibrioides]AVH77107.1 hypothetical protein CA607_20620 [Caulobacter vibrioides]AZH14382.1 hypothetical protein EIB18_17835 [Caulobacter vibrioides]PLR11075.1 hypothetical protein CVUC_12555 [Caulobacter vibrioides]